MGRAYATIRRFRRHNKTLPSSHFYKGIVPLDSTASAWDRRPCSPLLSCDTIYGRGLSRDNTHLLGRARHKKIIGAIKPSLVIRCIDNRRHAVMNLSD
jgi:hypothetical protein